MDKAPLSYFDGTEWKDHLTHNIYKGNAGIFVGRGPSLNKIDIDQLKGRGKTVYGVNNTYPAVKPDVWVAMDDPKCYHRGVFRESFPKVMRGGYQWRAAEDGVKMKHMPNMYFASLFDYEHKADIFHAIGPDTNKLVWHKNVFATTINLMLYQGHRDIYLAGVDLSNEEADYFNGNDLRPDLKKYNQNLYDTLSFYLEWLASTASICGINFYSISPGSAINEFLPYVSLEDLNASIEEPEDLPLLHCKIVDEQESNLMTPEYRELLRHEHSNGPWGVTAQQLIGKVRPLLDKYGVKEVLDYGAGQGGFQKALADPSIFVVEYDPGIPEKDFYPKPKEFTVCIDVLEHIEPTHIDAVLEDLKRVTEGHGFWTISTIPARRILKDGRNAHLIVERPTWWLEKVSKYVEILSHNITSTSVELVVRKL